MDTPPFFAVIVMNLSQALREKRLIDLISIAENWKNKGDGNYTVVFFIFPFGNHVKKSGSNFNQDFNFLSKSNLKCLFMPDTMYWR